MPLSLPVTSRSREPSPDQADLAWAPSAAVAISTPRARPGLQRVAVYLWTSVELKPFAAQGTRGASMRGHFRPTVISPSIHSQVALWMRCN